MRRLAVIVVVLLGGFRYQSAIRTADPSAIRAMPLLVCGEDERIAQGIPVTVAHVALAADGRLFSPCPEEVYAPRIPPHPLDHREVRELALLNNAGRVQANAEIRRAASQALGRVGLPTPSLNDLDGRVRYAAAIALGGSAGPALPASRGRGAAPPRLTAAGGPREILEARLAIESSPDVAGAILESLGRMAHPDDAARDQIEAFLVERAQGESARILGAAKGLEALVRRSAKRPISDKTRERLRQLVLIGPRATAGPTMGGFGTAAAPGDEANWARTRRLALATLNAIGDDHVPTLQQASFDADWQVRRLVAQRINLQMPELAGVASVLTKDTALQVRYELLNAVARQATATKTCAPLVQRFADPELKIVLRAIDLLSVSCSDMDAAVKPLVDWAEDFRLPEGATRWHRPSRALAALARLAPESAKPLMTYAVEHPVWQVRAMAAAASATLNDEAAVVRLARDLDPNVRNAAIEALFRMKSPALTAEAIEALKSDDHQLIRTAAIRLIGTPDPMRDEVNAALLETMRRLTDLAADTSRDPRVAIVERLQELLPADRAALLQAFGDDFDPAVRAAVAKAFATLVPGGVIPGKPKHRYPYQPPVELVASLPSRAAIFMDDGGTLEMELFIDEAPVTCARFVELVQTGYYNGLTFHRVEPNFVIQGGSPGANEYAGVSRYMRDEVGGHHVYGTVGISTRGRDTGDAQIFINLVDNPRLDHQYTVFARVVAGLDVLDRILEGAKIKSIALK